MVTAVYRALSQFVCTRKWKQSVRATPAVRSGRMSTGKKSAPKMCTRAGLSECECCVSQRSFFVRIYFFMVSEVVESFSVSRKRTLNVVSSYRNKPPDVRIRVFLDSSLVLLCSNHNTQETYSYCYTRGHCFEKKKKEQRTHSYTRVVLTVVHQDGDGLEYIWRSYDPCVFLLNTAPQEISTGTCFLAQWFSDMDVPGTPCGPM